MNIPRNVLWFEVLLYLSLALDALSVAFQDRTPSGDITESTIMVATVLAACLILLLFYFVWLAAQRISLFQIVGDGGLQIDSTIEVVSCALTAAGLYFSFTGDAQGWFNA
jgi:hypothetical protein